MRLLFAVPVGLVKQTLLSIYKTLWSDDDTPSYAMKEEIACCQKLSNIYYQQIDANTKARLK